MGAGICYAGDLGLKKTREWKGKEKSQHFGAHVRPSLLFQNRSSREKADTYYETLPISTAVESSSKHPHNEKTSDSLSPGAKAQIGCTSIRQRNEVVQQRYQEVEVQCSKLSDGV